MTRDELEHAIRAACDVADVTELYVFGSQAILGSHPDPPELLRQSVEVDVALMNDPEKTDLIDGSLGEWSQFHQTYGFYVHGLSLDAATLPDGWESRVVRVQNENTRFCTGWCVELHDLAASKLVAFRDKDRSFVRVLLAENLIEECTLIVRLQSQNMPPPDRDRLVTWVASTCREIE